MKVKNVGPLTTICVAFDNGQTLTLGRKEVSRTLAAFEERATNVQHHLNVTKYLRAIK